MTWKLLSNGVAVGVGRTVFILTWRPKWTLKRYHLPPVPR